MSRPPKKLALAIDADLVQDNLPAEVVPKIFIGSIHAAFNQEALVERGITHILNASRLPSTFPKMFSYLSIDVRDKDNANILSCIPASNIFIEAGVDSGGVLVHCYGGRSRSAALIAAFLLSSTGWELDRIIQVIRAARPVTAINAGFEKQLRAYAQTKYDVYLAQQVLLRGRVRALAEYRRVVEQQTIAAARNAAAAAHEAKEAAGRPPRDITIAIQIGDKAVDPGPPSISLDDMSGNKRCWSAGSSASKDSAVDESPRDDDIIVDPSSSPVSPLYLTGRSSGGCVSTPRGAHYSSLARAAAASMVAGLTQEISESRSLKMKAVPVNPAKTTSASGFGGSKSKSSSSSSSGSRVRRHIPLVDSKPPHIRLSRPGSASVRVIPPLRGLEKAYTCSWCGCTLFNLGNVLRLDIDVQPLLHPIVGDMDLAEAKSSTEDGVFESKGSAQDKDSKFAAPSGSVSKPPTAKVIAEFSVPEGSPSWHPNSSSNHAVDAKESSFGFGCAPLMSTRNKGGNRGFDFDFKQDNGAPITSSGFGGGFGGFDNAPPMSVRGKKKGFGFDIPENPDVIEAMQGDNDELNGSLGSSWGRQDDDTEAGSTKMRISRPDIVPSLMGHDIGVGIKLGIINDMSPISNDGESKDGTMSPATPRLATGNRGASPLVASGGGGLFRQSSASRLSSGTATAAATAEFSFDSPRIALPPSRVPGDPTWTPLERPQSAEKKRWLARANLLREGDSKVAKMAQEDDEASQLLFGQEKYIYLEYLEWMGEDMFKPTVNECEIKCGQCSKAIGGCCWTPQQSQTFGGRLEAPLIKVHKSVVQEMDFVMDATPRVDEMDTGDESSPRANRAHFSEFKG